MARLLLKMTVFVVGLAVLLNILGGFAERIAPMSLWYARARQEYTNLLDRRQAIQAISLGNSHSGAIDFAALGLEGQVLTRAGADLFEVERYSAAVVDELPALKTVFIALSYYAFSRDNAVLSNMQILRVELYTMLPLWRPSRGDGNNLILGKLHGVSNLMSVARPDHWHDIFNNERGFITVLNDPPELEVTPQAACSSMALDQLAAHAQDIAVRNVTSSQEMAKLHQDLPVHAQAALAKTIEQFQAKGIKVVLYTPPYYEAYTTHFMEHDSEMMAQLHRAVAQLQEQYQVEYYDFSRDPALSSRPELFVNSDHLNECGSKLFSERLGQAMLKAGQIGRHN
jgi:hypothetical protein